MHVSVDRGVGVRSAVGTWVQVEVKCKNGVAGIIGMWRMERAAATASVLRR